MQDRIFLQPIVAEAVHIDTVRLSHYYRNTDLPLPDELAKLGFDRNIKTRGHNEITTAYSKKLHSKSNEPHISVVRSSDKHSYSGINVECSLAKLVDSSGLGIQLDEDIECALTAIEDYVRGRLRIEFDAHTAMVSRFDVNADFRVGEQRISPYLGSLSRPDSRLRKSTFEETTNYFSNKQRTFAIYGKKKEMEKLFKQKKATQDDVLTADGLLRVEIRLSNTQSVKRFADRFSLRREATYMLTKAIAHKSISDAISQLNLDSPKFSKDARYSLLIEHFRGGAAEMLGVLLYRELIGEDFWKELGWSRSTYYKKRKALELANLWNISPAEALPSLALPES